MIKISAILDNQVTVKNPDNGLNYIKIDLNNPMDESSSEKLKEFLKGKKIKANESGSSTKLLENIEQDISIRNISREPQGSHTVETTIVGKFQQMINNTSKIIGKGLSKNNL